MTNLIVDKSPSIKWYTDLFPFFSLIESTVRRYDWLWTDVEVDAALPVPSNDKGIYWLSGDALLEFVEQHPQFIWSVLSAIPPDSKNAATAVDCIPFADGNRSFWTGSPRPQHPNAMFEVVCWDSSSTLLIGADEPLADAFCRAYPGAVDLDAENSRRS